MNDNDTKKIETPHKKKLLTVDLAATLFVLAAAYFLSNFQRMMLAVLGGGMAADLGLSDAQLAMLGAAIMYPYAALQIPAGVAGDKISPRRLLIFSCAVSGIGGMIFALSTNFSYIVFGRAMIGVGTSFVYIPALAVLRRSFGDEHYATAAGLFMSVSTIATLCASTPLNILSEVVSRQSIFVGLAGLTIVSGLGALIFIRDERPTIKVHSQAQGRAVGLRAALSTGVISMFVYFILSSGVSNAFFGLWAGRFYTRSLGLSMHEMSYCLLANSVAGFVGSTTFGPACDRIGVMKTLLATTIIRAGLWVGTGLLPDGCGIVPPLILSLITGYMGSAGAIPAYATVKLFVEPQSTGLASGVYNCAIFAGSGVFTQLSATLIAIAPGTVHEQFSTLMFVFGALTLVAGIVPSIINRKRFAE